MDRPIGALIVSCQTEHADTRRVPETWAIDKTAPIRRNTSALLSAVWEVISAVQLLYTNPLVLRHENVSHLYTRGEGAKLYV